MQHPKRTFARLACALTVAVLAWPVVLAGAVGDQAANEPISLEALRQKVLANEAKASVLRMKYRVYPENSGGILGIHNPRRSNRRYTYLLNSYAQDGPRFHLTQSSCSEMERAFTRSTVEVVDGNVRKSGVLPDLMVGHITPVEKFTWGGPGPILAAFRPYLDRLLLSDCLVSNCASLRQDRVIIDGRQAAGVEIRHPDHKGQLLKIWIDLEWGLPLRLENSFPNEAGGVPQPPAIVESTKFHPLPNGGWIPLEGTQTLAMAGEGREARLRSRWITDVNSISIEKKDIPDSLFDIQFPPGATVTDAIHGITIKIGEQAANEPTSLETIRQKVLANEGKTRLIRMEYKNIVDPNDREHLLRNSRVARGKPITHTELLYAQDDARRHVTIRTMGEEGALYERVRVVDGEVYKSGRLPDLMEGWIGPMENFQVPDPGPLRTAFTPYMDRLFLSDCLAPEYASIYQNHAGFGGREAVVIEIKHPNHKEEVLRVWIDPERGVALRIESHAMKTTGARPSFTEATKFHQLPNGGWIPVEGRVRVFLMEDGEEWNNTNTWIVDVNSVSTERKDIPDSLFDIQYPAGAHVVTEIAPAPVETKPESPNPRSSPSRSRRR